MIKYRLLLVLITFITAIAHFAPFSLRTGSLPVSLVCIKCVKAVRILLQCEFTIRDGRLE